MEGNSSTISPTPYTTRPAALSFRENKDWGQIRLVLIQTRSVGRADFPLFWPTA